MSCLRGRLSGQNIFARVPLSHIVIPRLMSAQNPRALHPGKKYTDAPPAATKTKNSFDTPFPETVQKRDSHSIPHRSSFFRSCNEREQTQQYDQAAFIVHQIRQRLGRIPPTNDLSWLRKFLWWCAGLAHHS